MSERKPKMPTGPRRTKVWLVVIVATLLVLGVRFIDTRYGFANRGVPGWPPPDSQTPLGKSIRLVGVQPYGSDDLLDTEGRKIGELMCGDVDDRARGPQLERTFIFEYARTDEPIPEFVTCELLHRAGTATNVTKLVGKWDLDGGDKRLFAVRARFDDSFDDRGVFWNSRVPIDRVDVTLQFLHGPVGPREANFAGPFEVGRVYRDVGGGLFTLEFKPPPEGKGGSFHFVAKQPFRLENESWIAFDRRGKRHILDLSGSGSLGGVGATLDYKFSAPPLGDIVRLVCRERPQARTFRNVLVRIGDRPDERWPEYVRKIAATLGCGPEQLSGRRFTPEEAMRVAHLARGRLIDKVSDPLMRVKYSALLAQQQRELRDTILRWARQGDFLVQAKAINLGLMWDAGPEFFQIAVGLLGDKDHPARPLLAWAIGQYAKLGPAEVEQVKKLTLAEPAGDLRDSLVRCLAFRPTPQAQQALRELQSAAATRPAASAPRKP